MAINKVGRFTTLRRTIIRGRLRWLLPSANIWLSFWLWRDRHLNFKTCYHHLGWVKNYPLIHSSNQYIGSLLSNQKKQKKKQTSRYYLIYKLDSCNHAFLYSIISQTFCQDHFSQSRIVISSAVAYIWQVSCLSTCIHVKPSYRSDGHQWMDQTGHILLLHSCRF